MKKAVVAVNNIFENSAIYLDGELLSKELLVKTFADFLASVASDEGHSTGLVLHTGSIVFDVIAVTFAAVSNLLSDNFDSDDVILSLEEGDYVIYGYGKTRKRYIFYGFGCPYGTEGEYIKLVQNETDITWVHQKNWNRITPYRGESTRTDGRGLRKKNVMREVFLSKVLEIDESKITSVTETSSIIIASRERIDTIVKGLSFSVDDTIIPLLDIVTASYFTENDEYQYSGNTGKNDPVLKITGKASVARRMTRNKDGNRALGLMVLGNDVILRNYTELSELINRKSLEYVFLMTHIDSELGPKLIADYESASLFACTREFLLSNSMPARTNSAYIKELSEQIDAIIDKVVEPVTIDSVFSWEDYRLFRHALDAIKNSEFDSDEKDQFIIQSYSLMRLFQTAVFTISELESLIDQGHIDVVSPSGRIEELRALYEVFPEYLKLHAKTVISTLEDGYLNTLDYCPKGDVLRDVVWQNRNKKVAIIVPKAYYVVALRKRDEYDSEQVKVFDRENLYICTANKFDNTKLFDLIVTVGNFSTKRFDVFRCRAAKLITPILYDFESIIFAYQEKKANRIERSLDKRAYITKNQITEDEDQYAESQIDAETADAILMDEELDEYIIKINAMAGLKSLGLTASSGGGTTQIVAIGSFETGEKVFFTKLYKAYVFDEATGGVAETEVDKLAEGDAVVFTRNNDDTRDIVDELLRKLIESNRLNDEIGKLYEMSKYWRGTLVDYMRRTGSTPKAVANQLISNGLSVTETTIRSWLDIDSHRVGPQKIDSLLQIAVLADDEDLLENVNDYFEACNTIRKIRKDILREVGKAIISKLNGDIPQKGTLMEGIHDRIDSVTQILRLDAISFVSHTVPVNATNRPLKIKES